MQLEEALTFPEQAVDDVSAFPDVVVLLLDKLFGVGVEFAVGWSLVPVVTCV